jgi:hypothetical protein
MKKLLLMVAVLALLGAMAGNALAEGKMSAGIGADLALPLDSGFKDAYSIGFGATARGQYEFTPQISGMVTIGYLTFSGKDIGGVKLDASSMVPIVVGAKYYFGEGNMRFYGAADIGFTIMSVSASIPSYTIGGVTYGGGSASASSTEFTFQPQVGFESALGSGSTKLDVGVRAMIVSNAFSLGARVGVLFPIGG